MQKYGIFEAKLKEEEEMKEEKKEHEKEKETDDRQQTIANPPKLPVVARKGNCPTPGCNGRGHATGRYPNHYKAKFCPILAGVDMAEVKRQQMIAQNKGIENEYNGSDEEDVCCSRKRCCREDISSKRTKSEFSYFNTRERNPSKLSLGGFYNDLNDVYKNANDYFFGGFLDKKSADVSKYIPTETDRGLFDEAKKQAHVMKKKTMILLPLSLFFPFFFLFFLFN